MATRAGSGVRVAGLVVRRDLASRPHERRGRAGASVFYRGAARPAVLHMLGPVNTAMRRLRLTRAVNTLAIAS